MKFLLLATLATLLIAGTFAQTANTTDTTTTSNVTSNVTNTTTVTNNTNTSTGAASNASTGSNLTNGTGVGAANLTNSTGVNDTSNATTGVNDTANSTTGSGSGVNDTANSTTGANDTSNSTGTGAGAPVGNSSTSATNVTLNPFTLTNCTTTNATQCSTQGTEFCCAQINAVNVNDATQTVSQSICYNNTLLQSESGMDVFYGGLKVNSF